MRNTIKDYKVSFILGTILILVTIAIIVNIVTLKELTTLQTIIMKNGIHNKINILTTSYSIFIPLFVVFYTVENSNKKLKGELEANKEINFRIVNKQNIEIILREVRQFYEALKYIENLKSIEKSLKIEIFTIEIDNCIKNEVSFLEKLKSDFYYDIVINEQIQKCLDSRENHHNFLVNGIELYMLFFSFDDESMKEIEIKEIENKAKRLLYSICFFALPKSEGYLREKIMLHMNDSWLMHSQNTDYIHFIIEGVTKHQTILEGLYHENIELEPDNVIKKNKSFELLIKDLIKNRGFRSNDEAIKMLLPIYEAIYETCYKDTYIYDKLGDNESELVEYFENEFCINNFQKVKACNYVTENIKNHSYI